MTSAISELIEPNALSNVFGLAQSELSVIKEPDYKLIRKFKDKIVFYYGMHDLWAPLDCLRRLRQAVPGVSKKQIKRDNTRRSRVNSRGYDVTEKVFKVKYTQK